MKALLLLISCLWLASCGIRVRSGASFPPAPDSTVAVRAGADNDDQDEKAEDSPGEAAQFYLLKRTGGGPLPAEKLLAAKRHKLAMGAYSIGARRPVLARAGASPRGIDAGNWQALGPGNIGGRTRALVIRPDDPNTMYAGSVGGGVWKTTDGGATWNPLTDLLPSIGISSLAMDPNDPNTLYAGTGEWFTDTSPRGDSIRGAGIFKTTDGGATWTQLPKPAAGDAFDYTNKVVVSPNNGQHVYAANWVGVYYSADGGNTWRISLNHQGNMDGCQDLIIRTDQSTDYLYAACAALGAAGPSIYRNVDAAGAGTWEQVFTTDHMAGTSLALAPSNQSIIYAAVAGQQSGTCPNDNSTPAVCYNNALLGIWRSTSNGDAGSWTQQVSNQDPSFLNTLLFTNPRDASADICSGGTAHKSWSSQGGYDNVIAVDPTNPDTVWVGGIDLFRSDDGGRNWGIAAFWELETGQPQGAHADQHALLFHPAYDGAGNQTLFVGNDGGIWRTDNALAATASGDRAACSPYATSVVWRNLNHGYAVTQFYHGSVYPGGAAYLGGSQDNNVERGSDATGPNAWIEPNHVGDGGFSAINPIDPNIWYVEGVHLSIVKTTNGGTGFSNATNGITEPGGNFQFIAPMVMDPANPNRLYTGGRTLWRTTDGAANWSEASSANPSAAGSITTIAVSPSDPNRVAFGTSTGLVFVNTAALSADKTTVWTSTQPRTGYLSGLTFDPGSPDTLYATYSQYKQNASQSHVYRSTDAGATWSGIDGAGADGLPDIPVYTLIVDPQNTATLYLGSDIGLFASLDGGATWLRDNNPFADAVTETLVLDRSAGQSTLFAFTHGRGAWKTVLPGSGDACQYSISANVAAFPAFGGASAPFKIAAADNCAWSAVPAGPGVNVNSPAAGRGNGSITFNIAQNATPNPVSAQVVVQNQAIAVTQDAAQVAAGNDTAASPFSMGAMPAVVIQDATGATESPADPMHSCTNSADFKTVWYTLQTPSAGTLSLTYYGRQGALFADSGIVLTIYQVVNGVVGAETYCHVIPQNAAGANVYHFVTTGRSVQAGDTFLIEVAATLSGAPSGANVIGGSLVLAAVVR